MWISELYATSLKELHGNFDFFAPQILVNAFAKTIDPRTTCNSTVQEVQYATETGISLWSIERDWSLQVNFKDVRKLASFNLIARRPVIMEQYFETLKSEERLPPRVLVRVTYEEPYIGVVL